MLVQLLMIEIHTFRLLISVGPPFATLRLKVMSYFFVYSEEYASVGLTDGKASESTTGTVKISRRLTRNKSLPHLLFGIRLTINLNGKI